MLLLEAGERLVDLVERSDLIERQTHDTRLFSQRLKDRLANPPHGVGDEFETARLVELLGGLDQAEVPFVDQVGQAESLVLVLLGYRDHETQVGLGQLFERFLIAFADSLGQFHLFLHRDELLLADLLQIFVERGALAVGDGFCNF